MKTVADDYSWMQDINCVGIDMGIEDMNGLGREQRRREYEKLKDICRNCDVISKCLKYAMDIERHQTTKRIGVYGGTTPRERIELELQIRKREGTRPI